MSHLFSLLFKFLTNYVVGIVAFLGDLSYNTFFGWIMVSTYAFHSVRGDEWTAHGPIIHRIPYRSPMSRPPSPSIMSSGPALRFNSCDTHLRLFASCEKNIYGVVCNLCVMFVSSYLFGFRQSNGTSPIDKYLPKLFRLYLNTI